MNNIKMRNFNHRRYFCSQKVNGHKADKHLYDNYINQKREDGIFLELGGFDGKTYSNSYMLENVLDFRGMLIEPGPSNFVKMKKNRPKCININCAISESKNEVEFIGDGHAIGSSKHIIDSFKKPKGKTWTEAWNISNKITKVKAERLDNLLEKHNIKYIDFWSLDVEGAELDVLKTMNWEIPVYIIIMEESSDWTGSEKVKECRNILKKNGFKYKGKYGLDSWWINNHYFRKDLLFKGGFRDADSIE